MGDSMPPPTTFDLVESFARRRGGDVEIVLAEPKADIATSSATVQLRRGSATVRAAAELVTDADGRRLIIRAPRERFTDGIWTLQLLEDGEVVQGLAARLLVQGQRPLVLLWGAKARATRLPPVRRPRTG